MLTRADEVAAHVKASQLADAVAFTRLSWKGQTIPIGVAFGAHRLSAGEDPQVALAAADRAMYSHKRNRADVRDLSGPASASGC